MTDKEIADRIAACLTGVCEYCDGADFGDRCDEFQKIAQEWLRKHGTLPNEAHNQDIKADAGKPEIMLVPTEIINGIARVRAYGVAKYGRLESWKEVEAVRYENALLRHALAFKDDPTGVDEESGLPHLWHIACNVAFLCDFLKDGKL